GIDGGRWRYCIRSMVGRDLSGPGHPRHRIRLQPGGGCAARRGRPVVVWSQMIPSPSEEPLLEVTDLQVSVASPPFDRIVRGVSFALRRGQVLGVVGESGSGKTMTALSLLGLLPPSVRLTGGSIRFRGEDVTHAGERRLSELRGRRIGFVFQDPLISLNPLMRIGKQV